MVLSAMGLHPPARKDFLKGKSVRGSNFSAGSIDRPAMGVH